MPAEELTEAVANGDPFRKPTPKNTFSKPKPRGSNPKVVVSHNDDDIEADPEDNVEADPEHSPEPEAIEMNDPFMGVDFNDPDAVIAAFSNEEGGVEVDNDDDLAILTQAVQASVQQEQIDEPDLEEELADASSLFREIFSGDLKETALTLLFHSDEGKEFLSEVLQLANEPTIETQSPLEEQCLQQLRQALSQIQGQKISQVSVEIETEPIRLQLL